MRGALSISRAREWWFATKCKPSKDSFFESISQGAIESDPAKCEDREKSVREKNSTGAVVAFFLHPWIRYLAILFLQHRVRIGIRWDSIGNLIELKCIRINSSQPDCGTELRIFNFSECRINEPRSLVWFTAEAKFNYNLSDYKYDALNCMMYDM